MRRPRICFVAPYTYPTLVPGTGAAVAGGAEIQQANLMRMLVADGYSVSLLSQDFGQPPRCVREGIEVFLMPAHDGRWIKGLRWLVPRLTDILALLKEARPDYVYVRTANAYVAPLAWYCRSGGQNACRLVFAAASDIDFRPGRNPLLTRRDDVLFKLGLQGVHKFVLQNRSQADLLQSTWGRTGIVLPNMHVEPLAGDGACDGPILWVGTVSRIKQPQVLFELAARLPHRRFEMIGGPSAAADAAAYHAEQARAAAALPNVTFKGFVPPDQIGRHFDGASLLVNTSWAEGFPNTFLQAWVRGIPSVSFVRPEVDDGLSGTISCSDVQDMAVKVEALLADPVRWRRQSDLCRSVLARHHTPAVLLPRYRGLFAERAA